MSACSKHTVTLDFDGKNSIAYHETGGPNAEWILRPVMRVKAEADEAESCSADGGTGDSGTPGGSGPDGGSSGGTDAGTPDGGFSCDPSDPSCPPMPT